MDLLDEFKLVPSGFFQLNYVVVIQSLWFENSRPPDLYVWLSVRKKPAQRAYPGIGSVVIGNLGWVLKGGGFPRPKINSRSSREIWRSLPDLSCWLRCPRRNWSWSIPRRNWESSIWRPKYLVTPWTRASGKCLLRWRVWRIVLSSGRKILLIESWGILMKGRG